MIADPDKPLENVNLYCNRCGHSTQISKSAVKSEIQRLRIANFEIVNCHYCNNKFSLQDFMNALDPKDLTSPTTDNGRIISSGASPIYEIDPAALEAFEKQRIEKEEKEKQEALERERQENILKEEKKKMQEGLPYDEKIVGPFEMEEGTPKDKNCVVVLKKEAEIYANTFKIFAFIGGLISGIVVFVTALISGLFTFILNVLKKINWCIACSIARITYFLGYIGLVVYSGFILITTQRAIVISPSVNGVGFNFIGELFWDVVVLSIVAIPLMIQLLWAADGHSRWSKVIKKHMDEILKK